jgi:hypothetical protein
MHTGKATSLDWMFDGPDWRDEIRSQDFETRCEQALSLIKRTVRARWATSVRMLGENGATEYVLLHLTNHDRGRDVMKRAMWRVCPTCDGTFRARKTDDPDQGVLLSLEPDLRPLRQTVLALLRRQPLRWKTLHTAVRGELWLDKHVNDVVRGLRAEGEVLDSDYEGRFAVANNPLLSLAGSDPSTSAHRR